MSHMQTIGKDVDEPKKLLANTTVANNTNLLPKSDLSEFAYQLHHSRYIYWLYGLTDALASSLSVPKLFFEAYYINSTVKFAAEYHHFLSSPLGIGIMVTVAPLFILFSAFGTYFEDNDPVAIKRWMAYYWPYMRDILKALKWTFKGIRNTCIDFMYFLGQDLRYLILPIGVCFIFISIMNRIWYRSMKEERKRKQTSNSALNEHVLQAGQHIQTKASMPAPEQLFHYKQSYIFIPPQNETTNQDPTSGPISGLFYVNADGKCQHQPLNNIENFYADLNTIENKNALMIANQCELTPVEIAQNKTLISLSLTQLSTLIQKYSTQATVHTTGITLQTWQTYHDSVMQRIELQPGSLPWRSLVSAFYIGFFDQSLYFYLGTMSLATFSPEITIAIFAISIVLVIVSVISRIYEEYSYQRKLRATAIEVELTLSIKKLNLIVQELQTTLDVQHKLTLFNELNKQYLEYTKQQKALYNETVLSYKLMILEGLTNGLAAHGIFSGFMIAFINIAMLASFSCPPALVIACTIIGIACLFIFTAHAYLKHAKHIATTRNIMDNAAQAINPALKQLITDLETQTTRINDKTYANIRYASHKSLFQASGQTFISIFECLRLGFSGGKNAPKILDECMGEHDPITAPSMFVCLGAMFCVTSITGFFKGLAKEIGSQITTTPTTPAPPIIPTPHVNGKFTLWKNGTNGIHTNGIDTEHDLCIDIS